MKTLIVSLITGALSSAFAMGGDAGLLSPCQREAQRAVLAIAKINSVSTKSDADYNKLVIELAVGQDGSGQVAKWVTKDGRFNLITVNRQYCQVENLSFNPNP